LVDFNLEIKKTQSINIKEMELNRYKIDVNIKKSIILYNMAIAQIKTDNLDLAINDLKKALSYNEGFSEAVKFMGLCYVNMKEYRNAERIFKKLIKHKIYSELAKEYIQSLKIIRTVSKTTNAINGVQHSNNKIPIITKRIIGVLISMIVMAGFAINYLNPSVLQTILKKVDINNKIVNSEEKMDGISEENTILAEKSDLSNEDHENIQKKLENTKSESDNYKDKYQIITMLNDIEKSFKDGNYEKAAGTLISMKNMSFDDETKTKFDKLWLELKPNALWTIYNQGGKLYKSGKYQEALPKLIIASEIDPNLNIMPWIVYQIGVCYKETNDNTNALIYFQKIKDNYPKSDYVSNAETMINQIGN